MERVFKTWDEWECFPAGLYEVRAPDGISNDEAIDMYAQFLADLDEFREGLEIVLRDWVNSCEHYLSNERMNRIAWLGQAAACAKLGLPAKFRSGYFQLSPQQMEEADALALEYLNRWLVDRGEAPLTVEQAASKTRMDLY